MYLNGEGVTQSDTKAFEWIHKAAIQGDMDAQNHLGVMFVTGQGISQSNMNAFEWFSTAAA
jgi:TPR repeat protein